AAGGGGAVGTCRSSSSCRHKTMRAPSGAVLARTVTAHILNSSAAAPWMTALRPQGARAPPRAGPPLARARAGAAAGHAEQPAAVGAQVTPGPRGAVGGVEVAHGHRVSAPHAAARHSGGPG